jgi:transposase
MKATSPLICNQVVNLLQNGDSMCQIASITGLSKSVIYKIKSRIHITQEKNLRGRPCLISSPTRRHLSRKIKTGEINTVLEGTKMLTNQLSINCSNSTTRRAFKRSGLHGRKKTKKPLLQIRHRKARLTFAEKYVDWTVEDWKRVLWSDLTKVCLFGPDGGD